MATMQDVAETINLLRLAVVQNLAQAETNLGMLFETGVGVSRDFGEAARLCKIETGSTDRNSCELETFISSNFVMPLPVILTIACGAGKGGGWGWGGISVEVEPYRAPCCGIRLLFFVTHFLTSPIEFR